VMFSKFARTNDDTSSGHEAVAPDRFVRISAGEIIAGLVDAVMQGKVCIALTGPAGSGKTTAAAAIRDELLGRSVRVRSVARGRADSLRLPDITAQLLGRPQETSPEDDIVGLFEVMTAREAAESRSVLIIDDAEVLEPSALEYLRLMATMPMAEPPQFVFVGRPEFWEVTDRRATSQFKDLITSRWELGRLNADMTRAFIERLVVSQGWSTRQVFDASGLAALIQKSDGLFGRILALLTRARAMQATQRARRITSSVIEAAAVALDGEETTALDRGGTSAGSTVHAAAAAPVSDPMRVPMPDVASTLASAPPAPPDPAGESSGGAVAADRPPRRRGYTYALGLVLAVSAAGTMAYWGISAGAYHATTPATEAEAPNRVASPAESAASGAGAPSRQQTTSARVDINAVVANQSPLSASLDTTAAVAPVQPESGQPTANEANRLAAVVPQVGVGIADDPSKQSVLHGSAQGPEVAAGTVATLAEPEAPQEASPPATPLPAGPTLGQMAAALAAAAATMPGAPRSPPAAMPSPAPVQQQTTAERAMAEFYAARGDEMLEFRDLSAARRFYETAANAGSGRAAMALARTYDPAFLSQLPVIGLRPDPVLAATWYRRAAELNVPEAAAQLRAHTTDAAR
jgi:type II secretory pathway predicted ATPase ExeA